MAASAAVPISPLAPDEYAVIAGVVAAAPPLTSACAAELAAIFGGAR